MGGFFYRKIDGESRLRMDRIMVVAIVFVVILWSLTFPILLYFDKPGEIGDSFGMMNSLFTALAFALLIVTSLMQSQELELQRKELKENRKQLEASAIAHKELVDLTRLVNREKIVPYISIDKFLINADGFILLSFAVHGGYFKNVDINR